MSIFETVSTQMKDALRAKEKVRLSTLRSIRAGFLNELKKDNSESLSDDACIAILRRLEKQRKESIEAFEGGGREEMAANERAELAILQEFLPSLADEAQTRGWVEKAISASGAATPGDMGKVMGALMKAHKGDVDGNIAKKIAQELLSGD
ncbi:MAG: GatB/YqeY domain-containing protein [Myxococcota bacterium]|nr:GatB/YqeY domain-containing protein [Myxococcota bacterium]